MKKLLLFVLSTVALLAVGAQYVPERADYTFRTETVVKCDDDEPDYCVADSIIIWLTDAHQHTTVMKTWAWSLDTAYWHGIGEVVEQDINFDGYLDLMVCNGPVNSFGNHTYSAWLWNQTTHSFALVPKFDEICAPYFVKTEDGRRQVVGTFRLDNDVEITTYEWHGDILERVAYETCKYDEMMEP